MEQIATAQQILDFWFSTRARPFWFRANSVFDTELTGRFAATYRAAAKGKLKPWEDTPEGALALVVVLDQFALNMFRGRAQSFATEAAARDVAKSAIEKGFDKLLSDEQKQFLYMPYMHSEDLSDQDRCVALCEKAGLSKNLKYAKHHRDIIRRFGRFPHRNEILGRKSTPEELKYLTSKGAFLG